MFRRILVAVDGSDAARSAFVFVTDWARQFDARLWFVQLAEESDTRRRNLQLASAIADAAQSYRADLIVLGVDSRRIARHRLGRGVREHLTAATDLPVLVAPPERAPSRGEARAAANSSPRRIALGAPPVAPSTPVRRLARV
jgi:nucleotide-binding universal stress UspA family protein